MYKEDFSPPYRQIIEKQGNWAQKTLSPEKFCKYENGKIYVYDLKDNLYLELSDNSKKEFEASEGGELTELAPYVNLPKMYALHSSSALCVNIFEYWRKKNNYDVLETALGIKSDIKEIHYEGKDNNLEHKFKYIQKDTTKNGRKIPHPHPDVYFECIDGSFVPVEIKYTEPFDKENKKNADLDNFQKNFIFDKFDKSSPNNIWGNLVELRKFYISVCGSDFQFLDHLQLTKHLLALAKISTKLHLIYIYYPDVSDRAFDDEIKKFAAILSKDNITFAPLSYIELIDKISKNISSDDKDYLNYHQNRYC